MQVTLSFLQLHRFDSPPSSCRFDATVSLRLGHGAALTAPRAVIHYRAVASLLQPEKAGHMRLVHSGGTSGSKQQ